MTEVPLRPYLCVGVEIERGKLIGLGGALLAPRKENEFSPYPSWGIQDECLWENETGLRFDEVWPLFVDWARFSDPETQKRRFPPGMRPLLASWGGQTFNQIKARTSYLSLPYPWSQREEIDIRKVYESEWGDLHGFPQTGRIQDTLSFMGLSSRVPQIENARDYAIAFAVALQHYKNGTLQRRDPSAVAK